MRITATIINYYMFCYRKVWLSLNHINMEQYNEDIKIGNIIEKNTFKRRAKNNKQVLLDNIKIDYIDKTNKILYETKKSSKNKQSAIWQMKYYLYIIQDNYKGIIEVPTERTKIEVELNDNDILKIESIIKDVESIKIGKCPNVINESKCKNCSFFEFCYS